MNPFVYKRAKDLDGAAAAVSQEASSIFLAGGTNVVDLMRISVLSPSRIVDISRLPLSSIDVTPAGVRIGATAKMSDVAEHAAIAHDFPAVQQSLLLAASPQLRNMATIGGNLLQRTRCSYFRDIHCRCNKRAPGSGCDAIGGQTRSHAVLGTSERCIASYPGDLAVALAALDANVRTRRLSGSERGIPLREFFVAYGADPAKESVLERGELITAIELTRSPATINSTFIKVRDRASYEFALVSCAAGLEIVEGRIKEARIALGGVGTKPWHSSEAEATLKDREPDAGAFRMAAEAAMADAVAQPDNAFKVDLAKRTIVRALEQLAGPHN